jgi:hypothetical protein
MKLPILPAGWSRYAAWSLLTLLLLVALVYVVPQARAAVVNWLIAGREAELRQEVEGKLQPQIEQAKAEQAVAKQEADAYRKLAVARAKEVAALQKERAALQTQVAQAGAAIVAAREDAAHVADVDLLPRIRSSLGRIRTGG